MVSLFRSVCYGNCEGHSIGMMSHSPLFGKGPVRVCAVLLYDRMKRISSMFFRIERFSSFLAAVSVAVSCNKLPLLISFFLLFVQNGTPPSFSVCLAKGSLFDLLTDSVGFSILFFPLSGWCQVGFFWEELELVVNVCTGLPSDLL